MVIEQFKAKQQKELEDLKNKQEKELQEKIKREERRKKQKKEFDSFHDDIVNIIMNEYGFNKEITELVFSKAWEAGHAYSYNEVKIYMYDFAEFVNKIITNL